MFIFKYMKKEEILDMLIFWKIGIIEWKVIDSKVEKVEI